MEKYYWNLDRGSRFDRKGGFDNRRCLSRIALPDAQLVNLVNILFRYTFKNVIFGIPLMVLIAAYIAVGSGFASVREYFEMNELQFFNAWPLKLLMLLLCLNLTVVTFTRIPLTPPRYG